jgi:hypothetical protein
MRKWEETKHVAHMGLFGGIGLGVLVTGLLSGQGLRAAEIVLALGFICLSLVEVFTFRARKKPRTKKDQIDIQEGIVKKGGVNKKPTTPRPDGDPKGQGGAVAEAEVKKAEESLAKTKGGFSPPLSNRTIFDEEKTDTGTLGFDKPGEGKE